MLSDERADREDGAGDSGRDFALTAKMERARRTGRGNMRWRRTVRCWDERKKGPRELRTKRA